MHSTGLPSMTATCLALQMLNFLMGSDSDRLKGNPANDTVPT
jgi:hypothetical protein